MSTRPKVRFLDRTTPPHIATLVLMTGLAALAMNVFLPSLPNMTIWFDTDYRLMQLSVSLYLAVNAVLQLVIGPISDRYGRRPVVIGSVVVFLFATVGTLLAQSVEVFLLFRMMQATVVGAMVLGRATVRDMVDEVHAASMIGYVNTGMALVPMLGPVIGGVLDEMFGWQASFLFLLGCGIAVLVLIWFDMGETARPRTGGFANQFRQYPGLMLSRRFWGYSATSAFASGAFFAFLGGAPYVGSVVYGLSPAQLGLYFMPTAFGYALGNLVSGRLSVRVGVNRMVLAGTLILLGGLSIQFLSLVAVPDLPAAPFFLFFFLVGLGNGMVLPNATAGMLSVRPELAGTASGLGGALMIGGGAGLAALTGALLVPGAGAYPLIAVMWVSGLAALVSILYVMRRARQIGAGD